MNSRRKYNQKEKHNQINEEKKEIFISSFSSFTIIDSIYAENWLNNSRTIQLNLRVGT